MIDKKHPKNPHPHECNSGYSYVSHATVACTELSVENERLKREVAELTERLTLASNVLNLGHRARVPGGRS